ncbi:ABC transporter permease [Geodermatophilus sp. SYSU D00710]
MTTLTVPVATPSSLQRVRALAGAETRLLLRNRTAVVNSVLLPLALVAGVPVAGLGGDGPLGPRLVVTSIAVTLVFLTYYNLVTTYVARREDLVLQRMRSGELTPVEVLLGTAAPTLLVTFVQVALVLAGTAVIGEWSTPTDVVLPLLALLGGAALMTLLAAASTSFTRTAESAQITTLPVMLLASLTSGVTVPLTAFPEQVAHVLRLTPVEPVVELARLGLVGQTWDGRAVDWAGAWAAAPQPLLVLAAWTALAALVAPRVFRWAPRR